ncbi:Survival of motor neuron-related-splicing factor 30, partial [Eumeta japonica]
MQMSHFETYIEPSTSKSSVTYDEIEAALLEAEAYRTWKIWKIGDKCQAKWTEDGQYYDATIEGITDDGEKEYLKKRNQKKLQRFRELEEEREQDKNKWLNFTTKNSKKHGMVIKSIFASPENVEGRVGI